MPDHVSGEPLPGADGDGRVPERCPCSEEPCVEGVARRRGVDYRRGRESQGALLSPRLEPHRPGAVLQTSDLATFAHRGVDQSVRIQSQRSRIVSTH